MKYRKIIKSVFVSLSVSILMLLCTACSSPTDSDDEGPVIVYVTEGGSGNRDGSSWGNAFADVQSAIDKANGEHKVFLGPAYVLIAKGTYTPQNNPGSSIDTNPRNFCYVLKNNVIVIGGFEGNESGFAPTHGPSVTILSGGPVSGGVPNVNNVYHVVANQYSASFNDNAKLQNLTISGGNANGTVNPIKYGGGMYINYYSPEITNCIFVNNSAVNGGGIYVTGTGNAKINNCIFIENTATGSGGGIYNNSSSPEVRKSTFTGNTAVENGGGYYNHNSYNEISQCTFNENEAENGGGIYNDISSTITNCTFSENIARVSGGGVYTTGASHNTLTLKASTFSGNTAVTSGGGLYINFPSKCEAFGNIIVGNTAVTYANYYLSFSTYSNNIVSGTVSSIFRDTEGEKALLKNYGGSTDVLMIKQESTLSFTMGTSWDYPERDQRDYERSKQDNKFFIGAVDPRVNVAP